MAHMGRYNQKPLPTVSHWELSRGFRVLGERLAILEFWFWVHLINNPFPEKWLY